MTTSLTDLVDALPEAAQAARLGLPRLDDRHLLSRFSYGITPALVGQSRASGGARAWFHHQLYGRFRDAGANALWSWYPNLHHSAERMAELDRERKVLGYYFMNDLQRWTLMRRMISERQVYEAMVEFWSNLLHVPAPCDKGWPWRVSYDRAIRRHALGRFDTLLHVAETHPAMGCFLDNARSTKDDPNENLGRELLELHTVGLGAGYSEHAVRQSMYILTGYRVDVNKTWKSWYSQNDHYRGPVKVLGFRDPNGQGDDGQAVTARYLHYLAHHPDTARRIAARLIARFVNESPPPAMVTDIARAYLRARTDIRSTLWALVNHPDFNRHAGPKVRTPTEDAVATFRAVGARPHRPRSGNGFANAIVFQTTAMGQRPFDWQRPDGFPDFNQAWTGASRMLNSFNVHHLAAGGYYPVEDVTYRTAASWLPRLPASLGEVVDHVCRQALTHPATPEIKSAVAVRLGMPMRTPIRDRAQMPAYRMARLLGTVLSTPLHMSR
ncbi:MAG: DUF1800 domain-containing protein [Nocardioidaceae bacterium]